MQDFKTYQDNKLNLTHAIAEQLRNLRESRHLSIEELSAGARISANTLKKLELGHADELQDLCRLARYYDKKIRVEFYD